MAGVLAVGVLAALIAAADGALLATGSVPPSLVVRDPERAHRALGLSRMLAHLAVGTGSALLSWSVAEEAWIAAAVTLSVVLLEVTAVEGLARHAGYARGIDVARRLAPVIRAVDLLFLPVSSLGNAVEDALSRHAPVPAHSPMQRETDAEHFHEVVAAEAHVSPAEAEILHGVFSLGDTLIREIMVPRVEVVGIDRATPWSEMLDRVRASEHARFPVFDDTIDNVLGVLYAKDLLPAVARDLAPDDWTTLIRAAPFIPATKSVDDQLRDFKAQHTHIALVVDEYGGIAGLVTIEDILEVIVGEIRDEYDVEEPAVEREGEDRMWVAGEVSLSELSDLLGTDVEREGVTTVGGLMYDTFGRVPGAGESTEIAGYHVIVERVRRRRIERVYFERRGEGGTG